MSLRILHMGCHSILEHNELVLFNELSYSVLPAGAYLDPKNPHDNMRPPILDMEVDQDLVQQFYKIGNKFPGEDSRLHISKEFADKFDVIQIMHIPEWIEANWENIKHKRVIWRTIGQSITPIEQRLRSYRNQGLEIVRYSPMERNIPGFIGEDIIIRFSKNSDEYGPWNGNNKRIITFAQSMKQRGSACSFDFFEEVTRPFPRHLFGKGNEGLDWSTGYVSFDQLKQEMRDNRIYFYSGTKPASYTLNFMEAFMTGIPIVAIGPENGNASYFPDHNLYEIPYLIRNGINGFYSDDINELRDYIKSLLEDHDYADSISQRARRDAIELFDKEIIKPQWKKYLEG